MRDAYMIFRFCALVNKMKNKVSPINNSIFIAKIVKNRFWQFLYSKGVCIKMVFEVGS